jgi:hypothetical protein
MKTVDMSWIECSNNLYNDINSYNVDPLYNALREAKEVINIVFSAGGIGTLSISLSEYDIDELNEKRRRLVSFCNAIHYEISQRVDNPFSTSIADLLEHSYDLDPSNFTVKTGTMLWWDERTSLWDLMKSTIIDEQLNNDFIAKFIELDIDRPYHDLREAIKEVRFWEGEFEKSEQCQAIADSVFTPQVREQWVDMSEKEKKDIIKNYVNQISNVLFGKSRTKVDFDSDGFGHSNSGFWGFGRHISINPEFLEDSTGNYSIDKAIDTLTHEMRHQYQNYVKDNPEKYGISDSLLSEWKATYISSSNGYDDYYAQEVESDARGFAALSSPED